MPDRVLLERINDYLNTVPRWRCNVLEVGPFDVFLNRGGGNPWISYARPKRNLAGDLTGHIQNVRATMSSRGYVPRWEYIEDLHGELTPALVTAGFPVPEVRPLMVLESNVPAPIPRGVEIRVMTSDEELTAASKVQMRGFGMAEEDEAFDLRILRKGGMRVLAAFADGIPVAAGVHTGVNGVTELAGIATLEGYRRRGIGAALTAALAQDANEQGCDLIFLSAGDEVIACTYARAGFQTIGRAADTMDLADQTR